MPRFIVKMLDTGSTGLNASAEDLEEDAKAQWKKVDELESSDQADPVLSHIPNSDR